MLLQTRKRFYQRQIRVLPDVQPFLPFLSIMLTHHHKINTYVFRPLTLFSFSIMHHVNTCFLISLFHFMPRTTLLRPTKLTTLFVILSLINFHIFHQGLILDDPKSALVPRGFISHFHPDMESPHIDEHNQKPTP